MEVGTDGWWLRDCALTRVLGREGLCVYLMWFRVLVGGLRAFGEVMEGLLKLMFVDLEDNVVLGRWKEGDCCGWRLYGCVGCFLALRVARGDSVRRGGGCVPEFVVKKVDLGESVVLGHARCAF